jgi:hypothetical protein
MADYYANTQITVPLHDSRLTPDVDLNGLQFNYNYGIFFQPTDTFIPITLPPPWPTTQGIT